MDTSTLPARSDAADRQIRRSLADTMGCGLSPSFLPLAVRLLYLAA